MIVSVDSLYCLYLKSFSFFSKFYIQVSKFGKGSFLPFQLLLRYHCMLRS